MTSQILNNQSEITLIYAHKAAESIYEFGNAIWDAQSWAGETFRMDMWGSTRATTAGRAPCRSEPASYPAVMLSLTNG